MMAERAFGAKLFFAPLCKALRMKVLCSQVQMALDSEGAAVGQELGLETRPECWVLRQSHKT